MAIDRRAAVYALVFAIPPAVGFALAVLRVGGSAALWQAFLSGAFVGTVIAVLVLVLAGHGRPDGEARHPE